MKTNKWIILSLFVSLAINLFMVGTFAGHFARHHDRSAAMMQDRELRKSLSDADKKVLKQVMEANRDKITHLRAGLEESKKDIQTIIRQEKFDPAALNAALNAEKDKKMAFLQLIQSTRAAAMKQMSPKGREIFTKMNRIGFGRNEHHKKHN